MLPATINPRRTVAGLSVCLAKISGRRTVLVGEMTTQSPARLHHLARRRVAEEFFKISRRRDQRIQIDATPVAGNFQRVDQILGADIAGGSGRIRAAADPGQSGVKVNHARIEPSEHVGQAESPRVVEMER